MVPLKLRLLIKIVSNFTQNQTLRFEFYLKSLVLVKHKLAVEKIGNDIESTKIEIQCDHLKTKTANKNQLRFYSQSKTSVRFEIAFKFLVLVRLELAMENFE